jgi:hypothetical protein
MPRRDVTLTDKIVLLEQIKNRNPNTSYCQLAEITAVPKSTIAHVIQPQENCEMNGHCTMDKMELPKNGSMKVRIQLLKRPSISCSLL